MSEVVADKPWASPCRCWRYIALSLNDCGQTVKSPVNISRDSHHRRLLSNRGNNFTWFRRLLVSKLNEAFTAGRKAVENKRTLLLLLVSAFMGIDVAIHEVRGGRYGMAALALVFFLIIAPWFGWNYIKPQE